MKYEYFSKQVLKDKSLKDATKVVANYLIHIAGWENDNLLPSNHQIAKNTNIDRKSVIAAINQLKEKDYIVVNENDNTFTFQINGIKFDKQDLSNPDVCHMFGDFVKVPQFLNYINTITPSSRIAAIMFFDFNFGIDKNGEYFIKKEIPTIDGVATYYDINKTTFRSRIQKCLEAEIFEYKVMQISKEEKRIIGLKCINWINTWIREDGVEAKKSKKLQEKAKKEAKKESIIEEKTSYKEDNVVSSTIEQLLDYEAKHLSDRQIYVGCYVSDVKDRLQEMIETKGKDYAINYMNEHWSNIDLSKVLPEGVNK